MNITGNIDLKGQYQKKEKKPISPKKWRKPKRRSSRKEEVRNLYYDEIVSLTKGLDIASKSYVIGYGYNK